MQNQLLRRLFIILFLFAQQQVQSQTTSAGWVATISGSTNIFASDIVTDLDGNVYTIGSFTGTADFGGTTMTASGERDVFIAKHTSTGIFEWAQRFGGSENDQGFSLDINDEGEIYAVGFFEAMSEFDANTTLESEGKEDIFIAKLSSAGMLLWVKSIGGSNTDEANSIAIDHSDNIYVVGRFVGNVDFDPDSGTETLQSFGGPDAFVLKLTDDGEYLWAHDFGASGNEECEAVKIDGENNVVITGNFSGVTDFDPGPQEFEIYGDGNADPFYLKLDSDGSFIWARAFTSTEFVYSGDLDIDDDNNIIAHGHFRADINFEPDNPGSIINSLGVEDSFTVKFDSNGNLSWTKIIGGSFIEFGYGVAVDILGDIYVTGFYHDDPVFDPVGGMATLPSAGIEDCYIVKYDSAGNFVWAKRTGGSNSDAGYGIDISPTGDILLVGNYWGTSDLDPEPDGTLNVESAGSADIFILNIDQVVSSLDDYELFKAVSVSPNPSTDIINVSLDVDFPVKAYLINSQGEQMTKPLTLKESEADINIESLSVGMYYLVLETGEERIVEKIVKM